MTARRNTFLLAFLSLLLCSSFSRAQQVTFHAQSQLVLVPVVINDKSGGHIGNLEAKDFQVFEDGKLQNIHTFEEIIATRHELPAPPAGVFTNFLADQAGARRLTIILLDLVNTPYLNQQFAREQVLKALSSTLNTEDPKALLTLTRTGIHVIHDFTTDPAVLASALRRASGDRRALSEVDTRAVTSDVEQFSRFGAPSKPESLAHVLDHGIIYRGSFDVPPGDYTGRILVRDLLSGRMGTVSAPVPAP